MIISDPKFSNTFEDFEFAPIDWQESIFNYLVHGFSPGGFLTSVLANNLFDAASRSHILNQVRSIKDICLWITLYAPKESFGSYETVDSWLALTSDQRREILENKQLLSSAWDILNRK